MKRILFTIVLGLSVFSTKAQSFSSNSSISHPGGADAFKEGYAFSYTRAGTPWDGLLISYGGLPVNDYDTQMSFDYGSNGGNHVSFRTKNGDNKIWNSWVELATKQSNNFVGNQSIEGNLGIGTSNPSNIQGWSRVLDVAGIHDSKILATSENASYKVGIFSHNENWYGGGGFVGTESNHSLHLITNYDVKMSVLTNGNVGIGITNPDSKLTVAGKIHAQEVKVTVNAGLVPDYVFASDYKLKSLQEVEDYIKQNSHLPEIPSAAEIGKNGLMLAEMNLNLLKKIEELTLYTIELNKKIGNQVDEIEIMKKENQKYQSILERVIKLENQSK